VPVQVIAGIQGGHACARVSACLGACVCVHACEFVCACVCARALKVPRVTKVFGACVCGAWEYCRFYRKGTGDMSLGVAAAV